MGDILGEWLKSTILRELSDGLQWLGSNSVDSAIVNSHFEDDGRILKAKISKPGNVQIEKFLTFEEPIKAWVSDSITRLQVRFATSAVYRYTQETRKRLTKASLGGIFQITDFEILATHLGPRPSRLTILIKDFLSVGSDGSGGFGAPRALTDSPEVVKLLDRLQMLRSQECAMAHQNLAPGEGTEDRGSPLGTQSDPACSSPSDRSRLASQEIFATQVSSSRLVKSSGLHSKNAHRASDDSSTSEHITKNPRGSSTKTLESVSSTTAANVIANVDLNANANANMNTTNSSFQSKTSGSPSKKKPGTVNNQSKDRKRASELLQLLPKNLMPKSNQHSTIGAPPLSPGDNHRDLTNPIVRPVVYDQREAPAENAVTLEQAPPVGSKTVVAPCIEEINEEAERPNHTKPALKLETVKSPKSLRIRYRDVKISKDQQACLDHSNSWIPAEPGQIQPAGNIPVAILKSISDQVEGSLLNSRVQNRHVIQPLSSAESAASSVSSSSESEICQDSEPEVPISSGQWPPSPPPKQLREQPPSDTSEEAPFQANRAEKEEEEVSSAQKHRKLSHSSAASVSATFNSDHLAPTPKRWRKTIESSRDPPITASQQNFRASRSSDSEAQMITRERRCSAKYGHDKSGTCSTKSSAHSPIDVIPKKPTPTPAALSQETAYTDQHICGAGRNHLAPSTISDRNEFQDNSSQEKMIDELLKRREGTLTAIPPIDSIVTIDSSEEIMGPNSSGIEIASTQLPIDLVKNEEGDDVLQEDHQSTATGNDEPVLQVKATPYVNGHFSKSSGHMDRSHCVSPSREKYNSLRDRTRFRESDETRQSSIVIETSSAQISSSKSTEDVLAEFNSSETVQKASTSADSGPADLGFRAVANQQTSDLSYGSRNDTTHVEDTFISATAPPEISGEDYVAENPPMIAEDDTHKMKRKFLELQSPSPETAKRQKQAGLSTFKPTEEPEVSVGASILGDEYGQDFYSSRKGFIDSHANEAPHSPIVFPQISTLGSHAKGIFNEGLSEGIMEIDAPPHRTSRKQITTPDPEDGDLAETLSASRDEEQLEKVVSRESCLATKTGKSSNATLKLAGSQTTDHTQVHDAMQNGHSNGTDCSNKLTIFGQFKAVYRDYAATSQQFVAICRKLERLVKDGHMLHQYLWDDFIIRHKTEYPTYLSSCAEKAEDPLPYEQFYQKNIVKPLFTNGIVKPDNIQQVFLPSEQVVNTRDQRSKQQRVHILGVDNLAASVTIDLTSDEEVSHSAEKQKLVDFSIRKSLRSLPWVINRSRVEKTPTKKAFSRTSSSSHISHSPFRSVPSNFKPLKASYRGSPSPKKVSFGHDQVSDIFTHTDTTRYKSGTEEAIHTSKNKLNISPIPHQPKSMLESKSIHVAHAQKKPEAAAASFSGTVSNHHVPRLQPSLIPKQANKKSRNPHSSTPPPEDDAQASSTNFVVLSSPKKGSRDRRSGTEQSEARQEEDEKEDVRGKNEDENENKKKSNNVFAAFAKAYAAIRHGNGNSYARDKEAMKVKDKDGAGAGAGAGAGDYEKERDAEPKQKKQPIDMLSWRL